MHRLPSWIVLCCLVHVTCALPATAEYRRALLIDNNRYDGQQQAVAAEGLESVVERLDHLAFQCHVLPPLANHYAFRDAIEKFAERTPTRSTALLYYRGRLADGPGLLAVDGRGKYAIDRVLQALSDKGGSAQSHLFLEVPEASPLRMESPPDCRVYVGDTAALRKTLNGADGLVASLQGNASVAVSLPEKFIAGQQPGDEWVNDLGIVFCWCPPGRYLAGSPPGTPGRYPDEDQHEVVFKDGFWLSKYELAHSQVVAGRRPGHDTLARHKLEPSTMINHDDARAMTRKFTASERQAGRLPDDWEYSLPTEEQWEYAARAGTTTRFYFGDEMDLLPRHANFADKTYYDSKDVYSNSAHRTLDDATLKLAKVGSYEANPWGFHDMYGNVAEWCIDGATRGGSWASVPENCRSAYRDYYSSRNQQPFIGYRLIIQKTNAVTRK